MRRPEWMREKYKTQREQWMEDGCLCCICGETGEIAHHTSYVYGERILVCKTCHEAIHLKWEGYAGYYPTDTRGELNRAIAKGEEPFAPWDYRQRTTRR